ncbi:MAG: hypothetical protein NC930_01430 [Candidatus Omnitrophica bacterium]|nr:hypothetical protein [Candidatus Omnitrophota bacterium]
MKTQFAKKCLIVLTVVTFVFAVSGISAQAEYETAPSDDSTTIPVVSVESTTSSESSPTEVPSGTEVTAPITPTTTETTTTAETAGTTAAAPTADAPAAPTAPTPTPTPTPTSTPAPVSTPTPGPTATPPVELSAFRYNYTYDSSGRLTQVECYYYTWGIPLFIFKYTLSTIDYTYDAAGHLTSETHKAGGTYTMYRIEYSYDSSGNYTGKKLIQYHPDRETCYDASGSVIQCGTTPTPTPTPTP